MNSKILKQLIYKYCNVKALKILKKKNFFEIYCKPEQKEIIEEYCRNILIDVKVISLSWGNFTCTVGE